MTRAKPGTAPPPHADLTVRQVAEELQVDTSSVYQLIRKGILPAYCPLGRGIDDRAARRSLRIRREDLARHKAGNPFVVDLPTPLPSPKRRPKMADHADHRAAVARLRAMGVLPGE
jgi:excisionase family DNA binding protein